MRRCEWAGKFEESSGVRGDHGGGASDWVVSDMLCFPTDLWEIRLTTSMEVGRHYHDFLMIIEHLLVTTYLRFMNTPSRR